MTPESAIELLDKAAAAANSNREGHLALLEAVRVLTEFVAKNNPK